MNDTLSRLTTRTLLGLACFGLTNLASAALISPVGASLGPEPPNGSSTFLEAVGAGHGIDNTWDLTGIDTDPELTVSSIHDPYSRNNAGRIRNTNGGDGEASIVFDLGGVFDLDGLALWNGNENDNRSTVTVENRDKTARAISSATVWTSTDGIDFTELETFTFTQEPFDDLGFAPGDTPDPSLFTGATGPVSAQVKAFSEIREAVTAVRLDVFNFNGGNITNFNEIAFSVVPEPATSLLGVLGLGLLAVRRKR